MVAIKSFLLSNHYDGILVLTYGLVQFAEFLIWYSLEQKNNNLNYLSSLFLYFILSLQPLSIMLAAYYFTTKKNNKELIHANFTIIAIYTLLCWTGIIYVQRFPQKVINYKNPYSKRLNWSMIQSPLNLILMILYIITSIIAFYIAQDFLILGLFIATLLCSYLYNFKYKSGTIGTMWCFFAIVLIIVFGIFT